MSTRPGALLAALLLALLAAPVHAAAKPSARPSGAPAFSQASYPVERYTLDNGLTVLLRRDPTVPVVITSYSIHYTKLYETSPGKPATCSPNRKPCLKAPASIVSPYTTIRKTTPITPTHPKRSPGATNPSMK